jgi:pyruvate/2-oxoglutarate/acetoin dehydrogenase E1 component
LAAIEDPDPVIVGEPLRLYRSHRDEVPEERMS